MAPLIITMKQNSYFDCKVCITAQHRQLLDQALNFFEIVPDYDLNLMSANQDLYDLSSRILLGLREIYQSLKPDLVFVHGDTTTSTIAALASFYSKIQVAHVEAGLRTYDLSSPFPEEANRQLTSRISNWHFAPTELSKDNLLKEGIDEKKIIVTGNTVVDSLFWTLEKIKNDKLIMDSVINELKDSSLPLEILTSLSDSKIVLITGHRRENFGSNFINICKAIKVLSEKNPNTVFIYPMHYNPNVRNSVDKVFGTALERSKNYKNILFIEPLSYCPFVFLMEKSTIILTDSGGIQEEAPSIGKPVLVMRDTTERPEAIDAGTVKLVGTDQHKIVKEVSELLNVDSVYNQMKKAHNPYGDGKSSQRICNFLMDLK